ncbi:MAG: hypothetical protein K0M40_18840 [Prolixibacteraceae bacterium]|nr:hypothetical protein [Prolixibacteraceae bacterium]
MSNSQTDFINANLSMLEYSTKQDLIENLFIKSLIESYNRINKSIGIENEIRDRFMKDIYTTDSEIKKWLQLKIIYLDWENWVFTNEFELARTDITFKLTGLEFILECKRLKSPNKAYIDEGLDRFIKLKYSKGDEYAGMIGFVVSGDKMLICNGLKNRIDNLDHTISTTDITLTPSFNSHHKRIDNTQISIYHLFFDLMIESNSI